MNRLPFYAPSIWLPNHFAVKAPVSASPVCVEYLLGLDGCKSSGLSQRVKQIPFRFAA